MNHNEGKSFWNTLPGILTAIAALLTAIAGLIAVFATLPRPNMFFPATESPAPTEPPLPPPTEAVVEVITPLTPPTIASLPPTLDSGIQVSVYWDEDNDGRYTNVDTLLAAVLELYAGSSCSGTTIATSDLFIAHMFDGLEGGVYCIKVINESIDMGGRCALVPRLGRNTKVYQLGTKQTIEDFASGFPYVCP